MVREGERNANSGQTDGGTAPSRRNILSGAALAAGAATSLGVSILPADAASSAAGDFDAVSTIGRRIANLRIGSSFGLGIEIDGGVIDLSTTAKVLGLSVPADMDDLLQNGRGQDVISVLTALENKPKSARLVANLEFAPLVTRPEKIVCVGFNYRKHAEETGTPIPKAPPLFAKYNNALNHHNGRISLPADADSWFDYETELVIVMGKTCKNVGEAEALDYVAGYATGNDFSARGLQNITSQFTAGKTADGFAPIGPWLVTRKRVADPNRLKLKTVVNGEVRQDWTTEDMIYNCRQIISYASRCMTLKPGDIIFTGTPHGVIWGQKGPLDQRRWLRAGDVITSSLEGLGELRVTLA